MKPSEYIQEFCHCLKNPRLSETASIYNLFQSLADYILGGDFNEPVFVIDQYTTNVFPRYINLDEGNLIIWDSHFWDLYGRFLHMYFTYTNIGDVVPKSFFTNYFESMMLAFLANRFENYPALSRYTAEQYAKMNKKYAPYNELENIEDVLGKIEHLSELNIGRIFGFCHEVAHIAFLKQNELSQKVKNEVLNYCKAFELVETLHEMLDEEQDNDFKTMLTISKKLKDSNNNKLLEEICCDIISILVMSTFFEEDLHMSKDHIEINLAAIHYFFVCITWLNSTEAFWNGLYQIYTDIRNDNAFVDSTNQYYNLGNKITEESEVRTNFVFAFCREKLDIKINDSWVKCDLFDSGFVNFLMHECIGSEHIEEILIKAKNAKSDLISSIQHIMKKNQFIGWEND